MDQERAEVARLDQLVLARLLVGATGVTPAALKKDLGTIVAHKLSSGDWDDLLARALDDLRSRGWFERAKKGGKYFLTPAGREAGLRALGLQSLPPKSTWTTLKKVALPALALGLPVPSGEHARRFGGDPGFKAAVLQDKYDLGLDDFPTLPAATDALAWKLIGFEPAGKFTAPAVLKAILNRELGSHPRADKAKALNALVAKNLDASRETGPELRLAVLRRWIDEVIDDPSPPPPPLENFADAVLAAARDSKTGRFGDSKVFIAHVWRSVRDDPAALGLDFEGFKDRLAEANRARLLDLARADLVEAMDPEDVRSSEIRHHGATYHFVRIQD